MILFLILLKSGMILNMILLFWMSLGKLFCGLSFSLGLSHVSSSWESGYTHLAGMTHYRTVDVDFNSLLKICLLDQKKQSLFRNLDLVFTHLGSKPGRSRKPISTLLRLGLIGICRMPSLTCGCWTLNAGPHDYAQVLLVAGLTL